MADFILRDRLSWRSVWGKHMEIPHKSFSLHLRYKSCVIFQSRHGIRRDACFFQSSDHPAHAHATSQSNIVHASSHGQHSSLTMETHNLLTFTYLLTCLCLAHVLLISHSVCAA